MNKMYYKGGMVAWDCSCNSWMQTRLESTLSINSTTLSCFKFFCEWVALFIKALLLDHVGGKSACRVAGRYKKIIKWHCKSDRGWLTRKPFFFNNKISISKILCTMICMILIDSLHQNFFYNARYGAWMLILIIPLVVHLLNYIEKEARENINENCISLLVITKIISCVVTLCIQC